MKSKAFESLYWHSRENIVWKAFGSSSKMAWNESGAIRRLRIKDPDKPTDLGQPRDVRQGRKMKIQ